MTHEQPLIFDVTHGSSVDGPGLRTVIFFKGCPLRCVWCQNPESQNTYPEEFFDKELCINCGKCHEGCNSLARINIGKYYSQEELLNIILRDKNYYDSSGGGVTFSGGEPLMFTEYLSRLLPFLSEFNIHVAIETCGEFEFARIRDSLLQHIDLFLYDIKIINPDEHKKFTGKTNYKIIDNFKRLINSGIAVHPRIPLIPGITTIKTNLSAIAELFSDLGISEYSLLPYNNDGLKKYKLLNKQIDDLTPLKPLSINSERELINYFNELNNKEQFILHHQK